MILQNGLLKATQLNGALAGKTLQFDEIMQCLSSKTPIWLHLDYSCVEVVDWLTSSEHVEDWAALALTEEDIRPRAIIKPNSCYLSLRSINLNADQDEEDMISIRIYIKNGLIITTRKRELGIIDEIAASLASEENASDEYAILVSIINEITSEINLYVDTMIELVDDIEEQTLYSEPDTKREPLTDLRRKILFLKRHINPQKEALKQLSLAAFSQNPHSQASFHQQFDVYQRLVEELDLARERCSLLQERISNKLSEQLNRRMYLFSLITALFLPISSVASLFGMNLGGIPMTNASWGFGAVCALLTLTSLIVFLYLKKKSWF